MSQTSAAGPVGGLAAVMQNALDLLQPLFTKAPASYQARLIAQFAALFYLFATSLLFLVLYCIYSRRTNRGVWLIRLGSGSSSGDSRSTAEGKLLTINSLPITALLANLIAIAMTVNCWTNWQYFVGGADYRTNALITGFVPWTLVYLQAYAFSFNNLFATLTIRKRLRGLRVTRTNPWLYHTAMFSYPIIVIGTMLPIFIVANAWNNTALEAAWPMYQTIKAQLAALQSGQPVDLSAIVKLQQSYPALLVLANKLLTLLRVLCALNITYASIIVFMHIYSLLLVFSLRSHVKTVRQISATATAAETSLSHHTDSNISRRLSFTPRAVSAGNQQDIALQRLTSDLTYSIPLSILLLLSLIATTCCILATNFGSSNWVVSEFIRDGFMWMYVGVSDVVATVFVVNLIRAWITENRLQSSTPGCASATQNLSIERSSVAPQYNVKFAAADEEKGENVTGDLGECDGRVNLNMRLE